MTALPGWLAAELASRATETVISRTLDEHLAHIAAQQATKGLVWDNDTKAWVQA